jgi:hypothetical protein
VTNVIVGVLRVGPNQTIEWGQIRLAKSTACNKAA